MGLRREVELRREGGGEFFLVQNVPRVVPALCMVYLMPDFFSSFWTWATSLETLAVGVPRGIRQKSIVAPSTISIGFNRASV